MNTIQTQKKSSYFLPTIMWLLCVVFYGYQYFLQVSPSVMTQDLMRDFNANATDIGNLAAGYFYTYACMQIPVGVILDRFGARRPLTIAILLCALGCFLFAATNYFGITLVGRLLIGLGASFAVIGTLYTSASWLPLKIFTFLIGITVTIGMLGAIGGQAPLAMIVNNIGWRHTMFLFAFIGLAIFIIMLVVMRDLPKTNFPIATASPQDQSILHGLKHIVKNRQIWLLAIYGGLMFMPMSVLGSLWGTPFLMHKYNITNTTAGGIITMLFLGMATGSPIFGWLSDYINRRKIIMLISSCGALISLVIVVYPQWPISVSSIALFTYGLFTGGFFVCFAAAREADNTHSTGATMGFMNMINMVGGALGQPLIGMFLDWRWQGLMEHGIRIYSATDFKTALTILPVGILCAMLVLFFIKNHTSKQC